MQLPPLPPGQQYEEMVDITTKELTRTLHNIFSEMDSGFTGLMQSVLSPCIETLIRKGDSDFWDLMRFMDDELNADLVALGKNCTNDGVRRFFMYDFPSITGVTKDGIKWRTRNLLHSQIFARLTTGKSTVNLKQLIEEKKCIIFNLDKGKLSTEVSTQFGKLIVSLIQIIAMQRGGLPNHLKTPTYLYIDEFHNYVTKSIKDVLAEARSNKLYLTLAQQIVGQDIPDRNFKRILMGNTNVKILAKSTQENYRDLADDFGLDMARMQQLPKHYFFIKVGNSATFRIKGWDGLIHNKNTMHPDQWDEITKEQISRYYVQIHTILEEKRKQETLRQGDVHSKKSKPDEQPSKKDKNKSVNPDDSTLFPF